VREHVDADRLRNYHKLLRDAERGLQTPLERIAQRRKWRNLGRAGTTRSREKRE
jgi:ribosome biogenesis GTPase / thiamine phosphate phosphatase